MTVPITPLKPEECTPLPDAGLGALETEKGNLPLESVDVRARLEGLSAGVEVVQGFRNPFDVALEATYVFPLPPRGAVTAFRLEAEDRVIEGTLKERGQARADYDRALAEGRRAAIAEEDRPDVFTIRVGNIVPGERVRVRLTLSQPLPYEDGAAEFRFPLVVAPRYIPGAPLDDAQAGAGVVPDTDAVPDASRVTPPVLLPGFPNPVRLSLETVVDPGGLDLREIRSSLHEVSREGDTIGLRPGERLDRDFILRLVFAASTSLTLTPDSLLDEGSAASTSTGRGPAHHIPEDHTSADHTSADRIATDQSSTDQSSTDQSSTDHGAGIDGSAGEGTFTLTVMPPSDAAAVPPSRDVVLLLDRSGSMGGWKMVAARRAAARIVDTLTSRDRFAVLSFDSVIERAFEGGLVEATDRNRYRAVEHLSRLDARGGTEILAPMEEALRLLATEPVMSREGGDIARDRVLVLVTDGQVGNEDQILERTGARLSGGAPSTPHDKTRGPHASESPQGAGQAGTARGIRVHTVGIDRAVNAGFLGRLALLGSGRCELVESEDRLDEAMEHIHRRIGSPLVTDISLKAEGIDLIPDTVTHIGSLYPGVPLTVHGRFRGLTLAAEGEPPHEHALAVHGLAGGHLWETRVIGSPTTSAGSSPTTSPATGAATGETASPTTGSATGEAASPTTGSATEDGAAATTGAAAEGHMTSGTEATGDGAAPTTGTVAGSRMTDGTGGARGVPDTADRARGVRGGAAARAVWARAHLRRLEDRYAIGDRSLEREIVETSLRFGVLCRFTAFVAVDSRVVAEGGPGHHVIQPVELPSGWEMPVAAPMMAAPRARMASFASADTSADWMSFGQAEGALPPGPGSGAPPPTAPAPMSPPRPGPAARPGGFGGGGRMPHPGRETVPATDLGGVLPLLAEELVRLRAAQELPERDRRRYLADLASRLRVIDQMAGGHVELSALAAELDHAERADADLDALWRRAVDLLARLTGDATSPDQRRGEPGSRRPFWKRS